MFYLNTPFLTLSNMARRRKYRRKYSYRPIDIDLHPEAKKGIFVILLLALGTLGIFSFFNGAGEFGRILDNALAVVFGSLRLVFAISLIILAALVYLERGVKILTYIGLLLFYCSLGGLVHLIAHHKTDLIVASQLGQGAGYVGLVLSYPLLGSVGFPASILINLALLLISLVIIFNTSIGTIFKFAKVAAIFIHKLITNLAQLIGSAKDKNFSPFSKREIGEEDEEDIDDESQEELEETEEDMEKGTGTVPKKQAVMTFQKPRQRVEVPLMLLSKRTGKANAGDIKYRINVIQKTLANFGIDVDMGKFNVGPTVTQYTLKPYEGVRLNRITALSNDLALALAAHPIRIEAPIPGKALVGIEVPNQNVAIVNLRDILNSPEFRNRKTALTFTLGKDVAGKNWVADISKMPHLLVAGSTGSGKSVCLHSIILSLLFSNGPDNLKFILVDAKRVELPAYDGIPHLLTPVITNIKQTVNALKWAIGEMDRRLDILSKAKRRDIKSYNSAFRNKMPYVVIVVDELADLMAAAGAELEGCIVRLAQMARAVGIHLILSTQRPSVDVITGLIKANMSTRIAFAVRSIVDSRTILDMKGAEKLLGRGDMLYMSSELSKPKRLQGAFVEEGDIKKIVRFLKENYEKPTYNEEVLQKQKTHLSSGVTVDSDDNDPLLEDTVEVIMNAGKASASLLQRRLSIGYARAARLLDVLERQGIIGPADGAKPREILMKKEHLTTAQTPLHNKEEDDAYDEEDEDDEEYENEEDYKEDNSKEDEEEHYNEEEEDGEDEEER
ncbi:DNA translocase FtsK [Patescibacteria group bacterium]